MASGPREETTLASPTKLKLDFDSLAKLDEGRINKLLVMHIQRLTADCRDRPGDKHPRKLTIDISLTPIISPELECESVSVEIEAKSKIPAYRSKKYEMKPSKAGLEFNQDFPEELDQQPLFENEK